MALRSRTRTKFVPRPGGPFKDGATEGDRVEVQELEYVEDQPFGGSRSVSSPGHIELGSAGKKFVGFGLVLLGLWMMPQDGDSGARAVIPVVTLLLGLLGIAKGTFESWGRGWRPFDDVAGVRGYLLRGLWLFRPRAYMLVWAIIVFGFVTIGSPHLRIFYGPGGCDYFGLNGWEAYGVSGSCPLFKMFPLS